MTRRHANVSQDGIRAKAVDREQEFLGVAHARQHVNFPRVLEQAPCALSHEVVVFGDYDSQPIRHDR
jgi:hypothetical protein